MEKPQVLPNPNFSKLIKLYQDYIDGLPNGNEDDDDEHYIYEEALEAIFGKDVWVWVNKIIMNRGG